jgi:hypothetical protein
MTQDDAPDPLVQLADWAEKTERRVRAERRRGGLLRKLRVLPVIVVGAVAIAATALIVARVWSPASEAAPRDYPTADVPRGVTATTSQSAAPTDPFAGTPAAGYPKGAAGITLPKATAVTGFTAKQVDAALRKVRRALIAGRLDDTMLTGHDPAELLALLAPNARTPIAEEFKGRTADTFSTRIDPAVRLDPGEQPRVSGRITYASKTVDGLRTLQVTTNFVWVYAFAGPRRPITVAHDRIRWEFPSTVNLRAGDVGMWLSERSAYNALVDCVAASKGLMAPTVQPAAPDPTDTEDPDALLRADHALEIHANCP